MDEKTLKLKRQVRDHFNKTVTKEEVLRKVAEVIEYKIYEVEPPPKKKYTKPIHRR